MNKPPVINPPPSVLRNSLRQKPQPGPRIETPHRRIVTDLPAPGSLATLENTDRTIPVVNSFQPPIAWERAEGYQVYDGQGNCWIDFTSTAVAANSGHGHPAVRAALAKHVQSGVLAQFNFVSSIRVELAERLLELAPPGMEKVYFWTVGSEAIEAALRVARIWGMRRSPSKNHILTFSGDYHGWTLGAHQLSGTSAAKPWLPDPCRFIHHLPFPRVAAGEAERDPPHWQEFFERGMEDLAASGVTPEQVAGVFVESVQGRTGLPLPVSYVHALRRWTEQHDALLIFDEVQAGFGRTGKWFAFEHYGVRADLICIGKGVTSSLPLAAVLGRAEVLDILAPGEIMTTHAAHPLSCAAALANLKVIEDERLVEAAEEKGKLAREKLRKLQARFPEYISDVTGLGLLQAVHVRDPATGRPAAELVSDWIWAAVRRGVMLFYTNGAYIKVCPPLVIPADALVEGIQALGDALGEVAEMPAATPRDEAVSLKR